MPWTKLALGKAKRTSYTFLYHNLPINMADHVKVKIGLSWPKGQVMASATTMPIFHLGLSWLWEANLTS
jgi:hypothetical protein